PPRSGSPDHRHRRDSPASRPHRAPARLAAAGAGRKSGLIVAIAGRTPRWLSRDKTHRFSTKRCSIMITDLRQDVIALFAYDRWANERIVAALRTVTDASIQQPMVRFLAHLARAQEVWLERVQQHRPSSDPIWPDDTFE